MCSYKNLELAWGRIKTSQNIAYKNYYRNIILAYELSVKENLQRLSERLNGHSYKPKDVLKFYTPKSSGLHRPITFLHLDDLIVYQALANIIADKFIKKRKVEHICTFSNILNADKSTKLFFFKKWQEGYNEFLRKIKYYYKTKNVWVAHFDLAAYYDTVDHDALAGQVAKSTNKHFISLLLGCLKEWSTHKTSKISHGLPQGPTPSALLGEIYLLPIDIKLNKAGIKYVRYVDDIKIYGKSREEVLSGVFLLESECKERGLIPQAKKFEVIKANCLKSAIGKHLSIQSSEKHTIFNEPKKTYELLLKSFDRDGFDISKIKYILKTSSKNDEILNFVLGNVAHYPDLVEEFSQFLGNHIDDSNVGYEI